MADNRPLPESVSAFLYAATLIAKARLAVAEYSRDFPEETDKRNCLYDQWVAAIEPRR